MKYNRFTFRKIESHLSRGLYCISKRVYKARDTCPALSAKYCNKHARARDISFILYELLPRENGEKSKNERVIFHYPHGEKKIVKACARTLH